MVAAPSNATLDKFFTHVSLERSSVIYNDVV